MAPLTLAFRANHLANSILDGSSVTDFSDFGCEFDTFQLLVLGENAIDLSGFWRFAFPGDNRFDLCITSGYDSGLQLASSFAVIWGEDNHRLVVDPG